MQSFQTLAYNARELRDCSLTASRNSSTQSVKDRRIISIHVRLKLIAALDPVRRFGAPDAVRKSSYSRAGILLVSERL